MALSIDIRKKLGDFSLDISFDSNARRIGILGPSGCGKSLTLKSIAGIERPDAGRIAIDDRVLFDRAAKTDIKPQNRNVGYMFQNYALFPTMTVAQNIAAGLRTGGEERASRVREMIERFHLTGLESHYPGQLSGGQQQRTALARIMAYRPDLILLDEPFSALDQHLKERLQHELADLLADYPGQVIMVSHSRDEIYRFADELLVMDEGRLLAQGETKAIFKDPGTVRIARMTGCKNITAAERIDAHTLALPAWGVTLQLAGEIPEGITAAGYRAHAFEPVWADEKSRDCIGERTAPENCLPFDPEGIDELPFERRYYIQPAGRTAGGTEEAVCWFVQDNERRELDGRQAPDWLRLREDAILLLKQDR